MWDDAKILKEYHTIFRLRMGERISRETLNNIDSINLIIHVPLMIYFNNK